jgi:hypothetical protein
MISARAKGHIWYKFLDKSPSFFDKKQTYEEFLKIVVKLPLRVGRIKG